MQVVAVVALVVVAVAVVVVVFVFVVVVVLFVVVLFCVVSSSSNHPAYISPTLSPYQPHFTPSLALFQLRLVHARIPL